MKTNSRLRTKNTGVVVYSVNSNCGGGPEKGKKLRDQWDTCFEVGLAGYIPKMQPL